VRRRLLVEVEEEEEETLRGEGEGEAEEEESDPGSLRNLIVWIATVSTVLMTKSRPFSRDEKKESTGVESNEAEDVDCRSERDRQTEEVRRRNTMRDTDRGGVSSGRHRRRWRGPCVVFYLEEEPIRTGVEGSDVNTEGELEDFQRAEDGELEGEMKR
jgi:hypothetical protein